MTTAVLAAASAEDVWRFQPHPEVWLLLGALVGLYAYAVRVIGPKVVPAGQTVVSRRQLVAFVLGIAGLWVASDWPMHDIAEEYLFSVHMGQHLLLTLVLPPLFLIATPRWLADLVLGRARVRRVVRFLALPVAAGVVYNALVMFTHWPVVVNGAVEQGAVHYGLHILVVSSALLMWTPVCGPIEEWRISLPAQMVYLFMMSVLPTVPGAWLTFATNPLYAAYDTPLRMWGISPESDQQTAGLLMKLGGGTYLWTIITGMFFTWAARHEAAQQSGRVVDEREVLTWETVEAEFARTPPVPDPAPKR
ncbi:MAG: cytochrome c oxidase assembly protein [Acidimicrobiales bacterium]